MIAKVIMLSLYVTFVAVGALLQSSSFKECGKDIPTPYFFNLSNCAATQSVCPLYMGIPINTIFTYTIPYETQSMKVRAAFRFPTGLAMWMPYVGFLRNGCWNGWNNYQCPAQQGQVGSYSTGNITVPKIPGADNVRLDIKFMMKDDKERDIFCLIVNTIIKKYPVASSKTNYVL
ncbi:uncharacterized protein LOC123269218 [Cotesia glomerata]|uniref:MD-2-related lipid-recognition domain-containing protein n=1 Tax=Cotesia glomerata TaxID=32391 RepID=A0AAV7I9T3_COTGL|nr:uncharacterized protein LOC123269218 [Cotesia glomerata]KAH0546871.1 hypothetical protein KQX54_015687 [Cotesia glomerata]